MTAVLLVSLYFVALSAFLGLDIISKVPVTMYPLVLAALGALAAVGVVGALPLIARGGTPASGFGLAALGCGAAAAGAGLAALGRLVRPFARRGGRS